MHTLAGQDVIETLWMSERLAGHPDYDEQAEPLALNRLDRVLHRAVRSDGGLVPPLCVVEGRLLLLFDEAETLRAAVGLMKPDGERDVALQATLDIAQEVLNEPPVPGLLAHDITADLLQRFCEKERLVPADSFRFYLERMLLEQGLLRRTQMLGGGHISAQLIPYGAVHDDPDLMPVPVYLPVAAEAELPSVQRLDVRLVASVHGRLDQFAQYPYALRALSIARKIRISDFMVAPNHREAP